MPSENALARGHCGALERVTPTSVSRVEMGRGRQADAVQSEPKKKPRCIAASGLQFWLLDLGSNQGPTD